MPRWSSIAYVALAVALGFGGAKAYQYWATRGQYGVRAPIRTGIGQPPEWRGVTLPSTATNATFNAIPDMHQTAIALTDPGSLSELIALVKAAHAKGQKVLLLPPQITNEAASANPLDPYMRPLSAIAKDAAAAEVDALCVSWWLNDPETDPWKSAIADVRKIFPGKIVVAGTPDTLLAVEFLQDADYLAAIGPLDLPVHLAHASKDGGLHDLRVAWACDLDALESLAQHNGRLLMLVNLTIAPSKDTQTSEYVATAYEALVTETKGRNGLAGIFLPWPEAMGKAFDWRILKTADKKPLPEVIGDLWLPPADTQPTTE